jgi:hypothetical protein
VVGTGLVAGLMAGCGSPTKEDQVDDPQAEIAARPAWPEAETEYQRLLTDVRSRLAELAPEVAWDDTTPARTTESGCSGPLGTVDGATSRNYNTGGGGAIPDDDWDRVVEVVREVVEPEGYDRFAVIVDEPAQHSVSFYGPRDAELVVSGRQSTTISLRGGCFLDPELAEGGSTAP